MVGLKRQQHQAQHTGALGLALAVLMKGRLRGGWRLAGAFAVHPAGQGLHQVACLVVVAAPKEG